MSLYVSTSMKRRMKRRPVESLNLWMEERRSLVLDREIWSPIVMAKMRVKMEDVGDVGEGAVAAVEGGWA